MSADLQRPSFAHDFPRTPELDALVSAFVRGNYRLVREQAPKLAASAEDPRVQESARILRERIEPDPLAKTILLGTAILLAIISAYWITHDGRRNVEHPSIVAPKP